jgi:hypothetical protein
MCANEDGLLGSFQAFPVLSRVAAKQISLKVLSNEN